MRQSKVFANQVRNGPVVVTICADGTELTVSLLYPQASILVPALFYAWSAPGTIRCTDLVCLRNGEHFRTEVVVGLDDGAVVVLRICTLKQMVIGCCKLCQLNGSVNSVRVWSVGVAFAACGVEEAALFYYDWDATQTQTANVVQVNVQVPAVSLRPTSPVKVTCALVVDGNAAGASCSNEAAGHSSSDAGTRMLLVGCSDGVVYSVALPDGKAVRGVALMSTAETESSPLSVRAALFERFGAGIEGLYKGTMLGTQSNTVGVSALWILQDDGVCHVIGWRFRPQGARGPLTKYLGQFSLPADADLSTVQLLEEVVLFISKDTGALCACHVTDTGHDRRSRGTSTGSDVGVVPPTSMAAAQVTPVRAPYLDDFSVVVSCPVSSNTPVGTEPTEPLTGYILLHSSSSAGTVLHAFALSPTAHNSETDQPTNRAVDVVQALQQACGGGDRSHPRPVVSVSAALAGNTGSGLSTDTERTPQCTVDQNSQVELLGAQLVRATRSHAAIQKELQVLDCELLQLTALLNLLGDDRDGLQLLPTMPSDGAQGETRALGCWSSPLRNKDGALLLRFRFRCEPLSAPDCNHGILLDVELSASTLTAMRALQGRTALLSLTPATPPTSLHPGAHISTAVLQFRPTGLSQDGGCADRQFQAQFTGHVTSMHRLCAYRLALCIAVDGPERTVGETASSATPDSGMLLCLVDELLPLQAMLPAIMRSPEFAAAEGLQRIIHNARGCIGTTEANSHTATRCPEQYELRCAGLSGGGIDVASRRAVERWVDTVNTNAATASSAATASDNPLRAAFLPSPQSPAAPSLASINLKIKPDTIPDSPQSKRKGGHDSGLVIVSTHRAVLAAVDAEVNEASTTTTTSASGSAKVPAPATNALQQLPPELQEIGSQARALAWRCDSAFKRGGVTSECGASHADYEELWRLYKELRALS